MLSGCFSWESAARAAARLAQAVDGHCVVMVCELEVSYLNYSTPVLLFNCPLDGVIEVKEVEGRLMYFINLI